MTCARTFFVLYPKYRDYIVNKSQTIDCLLTVFLRVRSLTLTRIVVCIRRLRLLWNEKKIVLSFTFSFFVMKARVNNSYIRKIHKQRNINCDKYVCKFWDLESMILLEKTFLDYNLLLGELLVVIVFKS